MLDWPLLISIVGAISGLLGAVLGLYSIRHNRFEAIYQFMLALEDPVLINARRHVYQSGGHSSLDDEQTSLVVNFYHHWGLMVKWHYLPFRLFDAGFGAGAIRLYELTKEYIQQRRTLHDDPTYAENFEWLYNRLARCYAHTKRRH